MKKLMLLLLVGILCVSTACSTKKTECKYTALVCDASNASEHFTVDLDYSGSDYPSTWEKENMQDKTVTVLNQEYLCKYYCSYPDDQDYYHAYIGDDYSNVAAVIGLDAETGSVRSVVIKEMEKVRTCPEETEFISEEASITIAENAIKETYSADLDGYTVNVVKDSLPTLHLEEGEKEMVYYLVYFSKMSSGFMYNRCYVVRMLGTGEIANMWPDNGVNEYNGDSIDKTEVKRCIDERISKELDGKNIDYSVEYGLEYDGSRYVDTYLDYSEEHGWVLIVNPCIKTETTSYRVKMMILLD